MSAPRRAPFGAWRSPITAQLVAGGGIRIGQILVDGTEVYWIEGRPSEGGRNVVVNRRPDGTTEDLTPAPFNARTRVHEYGGGAFTVDQETVYFSHFGDGRLYQVASGSAPRAVTPEGEMFYADLIVDQRRRRLLCVREDHRQLGQEAVNTLATVDLDSGRVDVLVEGSDFYSNPRLSPDGRRLCWLSWNHPNLPWDGTDLWVADLDDQGRVGQAEHVAGGREESIFDPKWSPRGDLTFVSDRSGWWNLYRQREGGIEHLAPVEAEFGAPQWVFAMSTYAFLEAGQIVCRIVDRGQTKLILLDPEREGVQPIATPYTEVGANLQANGDLLTFDGGASMRPEAVVQLDIGSGQVTVLRESQELSVDPGYLATPEGIAFPTEGQRTAYGWFYRPTNRDYGAPPGERPPLLVHSHGGPTSAATAGLKLGFQFWTSRGIAVLDVNYGGSSGYGRDYRRRLEGQWGVVDVDDCVNGARFLVGRGDVDGARLMITGGSAGGYTTLCALTFRDAFKAGASHFGIGDLEPFVHDTHKFESRYLDRLIGPYPEQRDRYYERSPINFTDRLSCPVILFQGLEDKIVPPNQAEMYVAALRRKGLPVAYVAFEGEQHGFRKAENIARSLEAELYFYSRVFGFPLGDSVEPVPIENLPS